MPTEGLSEGTLALKNDLPFRVNSDGWGDVWIETASGRRIGDLDRRIDADELNEAFALAARAEGPAPPGGGGEEDYRGSLRSAPGSTSHRTDGAGKRSKAGER